MPGRPRGRHEARAEPIPGGHEPRASGSFLRANVPEGDPATVGTRGENQPAAPEGERGGELIPEPPLPLDRLTNRPGRTVPQLNGGAAPAGQGLSIGAERESLRSGTPQVLDELASIAVPQLDQFPTGNQDLAIRTE